MNDKQVLYLLILNIMYKMADELEILLNRVEELEGRLNDITKEHKKIDRSEIKRYTN